MELAITPVEGSIQWLLGNNYQPFAELEATVRERHIERVEYIQRMSTVMTVDTSRWNILEMFKDPETGRLLMNEGAINKILFKHKKESASDVPVEVLKEITSAAIRDRSKRLKKERDRLKSSITENRKMMEDYVKGAQGYMKTVAECNVKLADIRGNPSDATVEKELEKIFLDPFWKFESYNSNYGIVTIVTAVNCVMENSDASPAYSLDFGKFKIELNVKDAKLNVKPHENNIYYRDRDGEKFYSPYISPGGTVCWGDRQLDYANWMVVGKLFDVMHMLKSLLIEFNENGTPHMHIDSFLEANPNNCNNCGQPTTSNCGCVFHDCTHCSTTVAEADTTFDTENRPFCSTSCRDSY